MKRWSTLVISNLFALSVISTAKAAIYEVIDLTPAGATQAWGTGISGQGQQQSGTVDGHAELWSGTATSGTNLSPIWSSNNWANATSTTQQVGAGLAKTGAASNHAYLWSQSAASAIDLNPTGYTSSTANATNGVQQGGNGTIAGGTEHALLWNGSAASVTDLHWSAMAFDTVTAMNATQQAGWGAAITNGVTTDHALLWSGTAASVVDLTPAGYLQAACLAIDDDAQGGVAFTAGNIAHAMLWHGTAASAIDLNPAGFTSSCITAISNGMEVGYGAGANTGNKTDALLWTTTGVEDLQNLLPFNFVSSQANGVDIYGDVIGSAVDASGRSHAILWSAQSLSPPATFVPEPGTLLILTTGIGAVFLPRRKRHA